MDQQTTQFQSIEHVVSDRLQRGKSNSKDTMFSPKQNIVVMRGVQSQNKHSNQYQTQTILPQPMQPAVKVHQMIVDNREETDFYKNKCGLYEKQINELHMELQRLRNTPIQEKVTIVEDTQRLSEMDRQLISYQNEVNRLNILIRDSMQESEQWKMKFTQISQFMNQKQQTEAESERQKRGLLEHEQYLQNELQRLQAVVQQSQVQMSQMQQTLLEARKYEQLYQQSSSTSQQLTNELERCTSILKVRNEELEQIRTQSDQIQRRLREYEIEIKEFRAKENTYLNQIQQLQREVNDLNQELRTKIDELSRMTQVTQTLQITLQDTSKYQEYEMRSKMQLEEISILQARLRGKQDECDKFKQQVNQYSIQLSEYQKYTEFEYKYNALQQENERISTNLRLKLEENDHLRSCIAKLQITLKDTNQLAEYENKIALQQQEIDRLHQSLRSKSDEIKLYKSDNCQYNAEINRLNQQLKQTSDELMTQRLTQSSIQDYQQKITLLTTEIERLTIQLRNKNDEIERTRQQLHQIQQGESMKLRELEQKNIVYSNEIDRLSNLIKQKMSEIEQNRDSNMKLSQLYSENDRLTQINRQLSEDMDVCKRKLITIEETRTERVVTLTQELDSWKQQFIQINREFHKNQEALILAQAELDSYKKNRDQENKKVTSTTTHSSYSIGTLTSRNI